MYCGCRVKLASCENYAHVLAEYSEEELTAITRVATKKDLCLSSNCIHQYKVWLRLFAPVALYTAVC